MPALSFFADEQDAQLLVERLNADTDIAFIIPNGPLSPQEALLDQLRASMGHRIEAVFYPPFGMADTGHRQSWKAVPEVEFLHDGQHSLWHVPSGPLPLRTNHGYQIIQDPWSGWTEQRPGADPSTPYFGPSFTGEIRLELWTRHLPYSQAEKSTLAMLISFWAEGREILVASDFQWSGDRYSPGVPVAQPWWDRLEAWMSHSATRIGHFTSYEEDTEEEVGQGATSVDFWAFPSALRKLKGGMDYDARGFPLDEGIEAAPNPRLPPT